MANLTPEQFEKALSNAKQALTKNIGKILINATNIGSAEMQIRVFNRGQTTAGKQMNYRSKPYIKLRQDAGLQTNWKDLIFTGDLFYSLNILSTSEKEVTYGFNNADTAQIAEWQQTSDVQVGEPIFPLNQKEISKMERQIAIDVAKVFTGALESFPNMPSVSGIGKSATEKSIARNKAKKAKPKAKAKPKYPKASTAKDKARIDRARKLRQGTYKPKKRKKK
jgi:hypothetical protein